MELGVEPDMTGRLGRQFMVLWVGRGELERMSSPRGEGQDGTDGAFEVDHQRVTMILKVVEVSTMCVVGVEMSARVLTRICVPTQMAGLVPHALWGETSDGEKVSMHGSAGRTASTDRSVWVHLGEVHPHQGEST